MAADLKDDESSVGSTDSDHGGAVLPFPISAKRQARNKIFSEYANNRARNMTMDELRQTNETEADEAMSIRTLLALEEQQRVTTSREYQVELFERAKERNTIAVLSTGSGKTHISVLLLRYVLDQELEHRAAGKQPCVAFFLVHSVPLVMQQHAVLNESLAHNVEALCGAMNTDLWEKETWDRVFRDQMVIVCTADILYQCLFRDFIQVSQINLLIFDEAHHAKGQHPYARIMRDFYLAESDRTKSPKVFGMTASPVDIKTMDIRAAASELEELLQSQIATASSISLLQTIIPKPQEEIVRYTSTTVSADTQLCQHLRLHFGDADLFKKSFGASAVISREFGPWCSDMLWKFEFSETETAKKIIKVEKAYNELQNVPFEQFDHQVAMLREAADFIQNFPLGIPLLETSDLSNKVHVLNDHLQEYFGKPSDARCITFVEQRNGARALTDVFSTLETRPRYLRPGILVGATDSDSPGTTFRQQIICLQKFRRGEINCLFATSIAEEGLDIPACNLVVRFDLYKTMIQYVQSRGRARHRESKYIHMLEADNEQQENLMRSVKQAEQMMHKFCEALPEDRRLKGFEDEDHQSNQITRATETCLGGNPKTKLTPIAALVVLAHFVSTLPNGNQEQLQPMYNIHPHAGKFVCEVVLPATSPVRSLVGEFKRRKALAKRDAAFKICKTLRKHGYLDQHWLPTYSKKMPALRNAQLAISSKKSKHYLMQTKPSAWSSGTGGSPERLYLSVLDLTTDLDRPHRPIGLLTRNKVPTLPQFPLFLISGKQTDVFVRPLDKPIAVDEGLLVQLTNYTLRAWRDIWNKTFEFDAAKMSYWIAPLELERRAGIGAPQYVGGAESLIDWSSLCVVSDREEWEWQPDMTESVLIGKFLVDRWHGGRRYFVVRIDPSLKPHDPVPNEVARPKEAGETILSYTISLRKRSRNKHSWDPNQPVLQVEQMLLRQNLLAEAANTEKALHTIAYVCPEPLRISVLTSEHVAMLLVFPAVIHRIETYLIALEAFEFLGLKVSAKLALEAMTKDSDNSDGNEEEKVNFQSGMGPNYERLEFLGDCFLKLATTLPLYVSNISTREEDFHLQRMAMLCNVNLFNTAIDLKLFKFIRSKSFSRRTWYPEGLNLLQGKGSNKSSENSMKHSLGDKAIADVCEAAIGAAFLEHNKPGAWKAENWTDAVTAVTKLVNNDLHSARHWSDYYAAYEIPLAYRDRCPASWTWMAARIEEVHDYHFHHPGLLRSAFTHASMGTMSEGIPTYERLEFLGDALLDLACVTHLFYRYPGKDPQWLTEHKSPMVSNHFLSALCIKLGLHKHLRYNGSSTMESDIARYVQDIREAEIEANGAPDYWTRVKEAPKCVADVVEAYVAAVFVDSGFDYNEVQRFFDKHMLPFFEDMSIYDSFAGRHPVHRLRALVGQELGCRELRLMGQSVESLPGLAAKYIAGVMIHDTVAVDDIGKSGHYSKARACAKALKLLEGMKEAEFKQRFRCDCSAASIGELAVDEDIGTAV